jgi:hypothetical protein
MDSSLIVTNLPRHPPDDLPANLYYPLVTIHNALFNLAKATGELTGIDAFPADLWSTATPDKTILMGNQTRMYPVADVAIAAGQAVNLYSSSGQLRARLADASNSTTLANGVSTTAASAGSQVEINWMRGFISSIGGLTPGSSYWLSTTPGAIQDFPPPGATQQFLGLATSSQGLILDIAQAAVGSCGTNAPTEFTQSSPAATWVVNHALGYKPASISCFNGGGVGILGEVSHTSTAQFTVSFVRALAGTVLYA